MTQTTLEQAMQVAISHHQAGRLAEAEGIYRTVLSRFPEHAEAHCNLGVILKDQGRIDDALDAYRRAIELKPVLAEAHNNLGRALKAQERLDEAIEAYNRAIQLRPGFAAAHTNLGNALKDRGRLDEAIDAHRRAIELKPGYAEAYSNLGNALTDQKRLDEAIGAYRRAIQLRPDLAEAYSNLGNTLRDQGRLDEAIDAYHRAIELKPDLAEAYSNLGKAFIEQGRLDEGYTSFRKATALKPHFFGAASNLLFTLHYHPDLAGQAILTEHRHWAKQYTETLTAEIRPHPNDRSPGRTLRVGFVSPDLRNHPVGYSLLPLFRHHDPRQTEFLCYSDVRMPDALTGMLKAKAEAWCDIVGTSDAQVAERIRSDRIDILVDLTLHAAGNRLLVFARKPAPVQVTLLGPPTTTGLDTMDYRLTDPYLDPPGSADADYTERSIRLPHCFWNFQPPEESDTPPVTSLPARRNGFVTFGCLNQFAKVTRPALELWVRILQALPGSRLVLQAPAGSHLDAVRILFQQGGIAVDRLEFVARSARREYLHRFDSIDLALDPFPYNGHSSSLDALWMGVPFITLAGRTAVGRGGASILSNVGLPALIAQTPEQYVELALELAADLDRLSELRAELRQRMQSSPLVDGKQYATDVEAAFRQMWTNWCAS